MAACLPGFASVPLDSLRATHRRRRSTHSSSAATARARSTSRAGSGWTTRSPSDSASSHEGTNRAVGARAALRVHGPVEASGRKFTSAVGALDRSAGIAAASGAELVVFHPGFLLEREREEAIAAVVEQLGTLRERLEGKDRAVPFGIEMMGRVRDLGSLDDVVEISRRTTWVRPVLDFAHMHATSDGAFVDAKPFPGSPCSCRRGPRSPTRRSTSIFPISPSRTATRRSIFPTATEPSGRSRWRDALGRFRARRDRNLRVAGRALESGYSLGARRRWGDEFREPRLIRMRCRRRGPDHGQKIRRSRSSGSISKTSK